MVIKSKSGKNIITAGEVASFVVCPEAWRLQQVARVRPAYTPSKQASEGSRQGKHLHKEWAKTLEEAQFLIRGVRLIVYLIGIAVLTLVYSMS